MKRYQAGKYSTGGFDRVDCHLENQRIYQQVDLQLSAQSSNWQSLGSDRITGD